MYMEIRQSKVMLIKPVWLFQSHALLGSLKEPKSKYRRKNVHIKTYIIKNIMLSCLISESTVHVFWNGIVGERFKS